MSDQPETITLDLLGLLLREAQRELREVRNDQREQLKLLLAVVEQGRRTDRHIVELRDDLELMLKAELMGRLGHFETQVDQRVEDLAERVEALEGNTPPK